MVITDYTFSPSTQEVTLNNIEIETERVLVITCIEPTRHRILYAPGFESLPLAGTSVISGGDTIITLQYDTTTGGFLSTDLLQIRVCTEDDLLTLQEIENLLTFIEIDTTAISISLGTDGATPPSIPGTGVRGWLRSIYDELVLIYTRINTWSTGAGSANSNTLRVVESAPATTDILNGSATTETTIITVTANKIWKGEISVSCSRAVGSSSSESQASTLVTWSPGSGGSNSYVPARVNLSVPFVLLTALVGSGQNGAITVKVEVYAGTTAGTFVLSQSSCDQYFASCNGKTL